MTELDEAIAREEAEDRAANQANTRIELARVELAPVLLSFLAELQRFEQTAQVKIADGCLVDLENATTFIMGLKLDADTVPAIDTMIEKVSAFIRPAKAA